MRTLRSVEAGISGKSLLLLSGGGRELVERSLDAAEWSSVLGQPLDADAVRRATFTGPPLGSNQFVEELEIVLGPG